ncbi:FMN-linked oxidoreductase [Hortaea werneckii]|nr:FMN-linked oxidoreductase [Hortaea werneckii]
MAPMTRFRTDTDHCPLSIGKEYYGQRSHSAGTLIITEGTSVSERLVGLAHWAGCWTESQLDKWKEIVERVHSRGCYIFLQLCCAGRTADKGFPKLSSSDIPLQPHASAIETEDDDKPPTPMTEQDIKSAIHDHATAARNAIVVGFDGGGSVENRSRFALETAAAVVDAVGADCVGFRISPWSTYHSITPINPEAQFQHLVTELRKLNLAYLHVITSRVDNWQDVERVKPLDFIFDSWTKNIPVIITGGFDGESAEEAVGTASKGFQVAVGFGRSFASTSDLVTCIKKGIAPNVFTGELAYTAGTPSGYIDYPFLS